MIVPREFIKDNRSAGLAPAMIPLVLAAPPLAMEANDDSRSSAAPGVAVLPVVPRALVRDAAVAPDPTVALT